VPQAVATGMVTDVDGDPLPGVQVTALSCHYLAGSRQMIPFVGAYTDDQGLFRIAGLAPGRAYLSATDRRTNEPTPEVNVTTYYPGTFDAAGALPVELTAGSTVRADIVMRRTRVFSIRGRALDNSRNPVVNTGLSITSSNERVLNLTNRRTAQTLATDGSFEFR